jgi:WD40 repeat protein/serine/threonine protein kinase
MSENESFLDVSAGDSTRLEDLVEEFERALGRGERPALEDYLTRGGRRHALLVELIHAELECRLKGGEAVRVEDYLNRYPEFAADPVAAVDLIRAEFALRCRREPGVTPDEFHQRFPQWHDQLRLHTSPSLAPTVAAPTARGSRTRGPGTPSRSSPTPHWDDAGAALPDAPRIPGYEILGLLGRGGMGVVYKARQTALQRLVALKTIRDEALAGPDALARFHREAEAIARLQHPNIVQIFEVGRHEGRSFFSLELVVGGSLAERLAHTPLPPRSAARLVEQLARTMHVAHRQGIVHRDLKPANVLLQKSEAGGLPPGEPASDLCPKITDFGLAKSLEGSSTQTQSGAIMGTPSYMAPEQALGSPDRIGPAADVYALGAILYEMLTGRPPFRGDSPLETIEQVRSWEPVPPRLLQPKVPRDLETICLTCLRKEPPRRYASALALAEDCRAFLAGEPIRARATSWWERAAKWARRRPALASLYAVSVLALLTVLVGGTVFLVQLRIAWEKTDLEHTRAVEKQLLAEQKQHLAEQNEARALWNAYVAEMNLAQRAFWEADVVHAEDLLRHQSAPAGHKDLRGFEWYYLWRLCHAERLVLRGHTGGVDALAVHPVEPTLATGGRDGTVRVWDLRTGKERYPPRLHPGPVVEVAFTAHGRQVVSASRGEPFSIKGVLIHDANTGELVGAVPSFPRKLRGLAFSPDGKQFAAAFEEGPAGKVELCDLATGKRVSLLDGHARAVTCLVFSPDGMRLATASFTAAPEAIQGEVKLWDLKTGKALRILTGHRDSISSLSFTADGSRLASACGTSNDQAVKIWETQTGKEVLSLPEGGCRPVFSPDGRRLAITRFDKTVRLHDARTGQELFILPGHGSMVGNLAFSGDGQLLATTGGPAVKVWDVTSGPEARTLTVGGLALRTAAFSPDGRVLATTSGAYRFAEGPPRESVFFWDAATGRKLRTLPGLPASYTETAFSPDLRQLVVVGEDDFRPVGDPARYRVQVLDAVSGQELRVLRGHSGRVSRPAFSPTGRHLAAAVGQIGQPGQVKVWDPATGEELLLLRGHTLSIETIAFSPDESLLVSTSQDGTVRVWDARTGAPVAVSPRQPVPYLGAAFSPDGQQLAVASGDWTVKIWKANLTGEPLVLRGHTFPVCCVAFLPGEERLVTASNDQTLKVWDAVTGKELATLRGHKGAVWGLAVAANGRRLASCSQDGTARVWDATPW